MIKIENTHDSKSYWKGDDIYDSKRNKTKKIKLFGLTIWENTDNYNCELTEDNKNGIGFKKLN